MRYWADFNDVEDVETDAETASITGLVLHDDPVSINDSILIEDHDGNKCEGTLLREFTSQSGRRLFTAVVDLSTFTTKEIP